MKRSRPIPPSRPFGPFRSAWPPNHDDLAEPIPDPIRVSCLLDAGWDHLGIDLSARPSGASVLP